jgi:hypothetical protein
VPRDEIERVTIDPTSTRARISIEEVTGGGPSYDQQYSPVTIGVYLAPDDLAKRAFVVDTFEKAIGLEPLY